MEQWYTLYTKPNTEYQVAATLQERGLQTYLPELGHPPVQPGHAKKPFFPCYLFSRIDFETTGLIQIQWTPGLRRVVTFDGRPVPLADEFIQLIQGKLVELEAKLSHPVSFFKPGETVRITAGPFQDLLAIFDGPITPGRRVQVLLTILGHANRVQLNVTDIDRAMSNAASLKLKRRRGTRGRGRWINNLSE